MKKINSMTTMLITVFLCATITLFAADGDFIGTDDYATTLYNWSDGSGWAGGIVPDGAGATAYITNAIYPSNTSFAKGIALDNNPTIETLYLALDKTEVDAVSVALALGTLTLEGSPEINVVASPNFLGGFIGAAGFGGVLDGTVGFTKTGNGALYLDGVHTISGPLNLNEGPVILWNPNGAQNLDVIVNSNSTLIAASSTNNIKSITVNSDGILEVLADPVRNPYYIFSPSIIIKSNGYFRVTDFYGVLTRGSNITVKSGGSIYCNVYQTFIIENNITLEGEGHFGGAIEIANVSADGVFNGQLTMTGNTRILQHGESGSMTFNSPFTGTGNLDFVASADNASHTKTYYLNAQSTHSGTTSLRAVNCLTSFEIGTNDCLPSDQPLSFIIDHLSNSVALNVNMKDFIQNVPTLDLGCGEGLDKIILNGNDGSKLSVAGNVNQSGGIAEIITCELEISGTLAANGSMLGMSNVTLLSGASIGGTGTVDELTVPSGVAIAPGGSIGTLNIISNLTMEAGSSINWEVGDPGSADLININGSFTISGGMTINAIDAGLPEGTYTIVQTTDGIIGDASSITMSYSAGIEGDANPTINGNNLEVNIIPEPFLFIIYSLSFTIYYIRKRK